MKNIKIEDFQEMTLNLIKKVEGLSLIPYFCDANKNTIDYGHVILPTESYEKITKEQAEEILRDDLQKFMKEYVKLIKVDLNPNQHTSLVSLMFNIGINAFEESTLLKLINKNADIVLIKQEFLRWKFVKKQENKGLFKRRLIEWETYIK